MVTFAGKWLPCGCKQKILGVASHHSKLVDVVFNFAVDHMMRVESPQINMLHIVFYANKFY